MSIRSNAAKKYQDIRNRGSFKRIGQRRRSYRTLLRLFQAVKQCDGPLVRQLLQAGSVRIKSTAVSKTRHKGNGNFTSLLMLNARYGDSDITRSLIRAGYCHRLNRTIPDGDAALHIAVNYRNFDVASELIRFGANVCAKNDRGKSLLDAAIVNTTHLNHLVNALTKSFTRSIQIMPYALRSLLFVCMAQTNSSHITRCYERGETVDVSLNLVKLLLDAGAEVNHKDANGCSPIQLAAFTGNLELVKILLDAGADIDSKNVIGATALHNAVMSNDEAMVLLLLRRGASVALKTQEGDTALHWASVYDTNNRHGTIIKNLLEFGCNANEKNAKLKTILDLLIQEGESARCHMVIEYVTEVEAKTNKRLFDEHNLAVINGDTELKSHYDKCQDELTSMKNCKIGDTLIRYIAVLTEPEEVLARYARNEDFVSEFKAGDYESVYPIHKSMLKAKFIMAIITQKMIERASVILSTTLQFADPSNAAFEIIAQYLTTADMKFLIDSAAAESTNSENK